MATNKIIFESKRPNIRFIINNLHLSLTSYIECC